MPLLKADYVMLQRGSKRAQEFIWRAHIAERIAAALAKQSVNKRWPPIETKECHRSKQNGQAVTLRRTGYVT